jgi:hypothetical protein
MRSFFLALIIALAATTGINCIAFGAGVSCRDALTDADLPSRFVRMDDSRGFLAEEFMLSPATFNKKLIAGDVNAGLIRAHAFRFEGLFRLFADAKELKNHERHKIKKLLNRIKDLEDNLGWYSEPLEHVAKLKTLKGSAVMPDDLYDYLLKRFTKESVEGRKKLVEFLKEEKWIGANDQRHSALAELDEGLATIETLSRKADRRALLATLSEYIKNCDKKIDELARLETLDSISDEVHPARRWLRWISIMFAAGNIFELDKSPSPLAEFRGVKTDPEMVKYAGIKIYGEEKDPVKINEELFVAMTNYVGELGHAKDLGEFEEAVRAALVDRGFLPVTAQRRAVIITSSVPGYFEPFERAHNDFVTITKTGLLAELRREVEAGF